MEQRNDNLRERLLSRLPQPENLPRYQEETASLMVRHERALFWERATARMLSLAALAVYFLAISSFGHKLGTNEQVYLEVMAALLFIGAMFSGLGYMISRSKVDILKEVKQVQLQILELQAKVETYQR